MALEDYDRLQAAEFGTSGALRQRPSGTSSMLRRQTEAYSRAQRLLDRSARRGDINSALGAIKLRNESIGAGINTSSLRTAGDNRNSIAQREAGLGQAAQDMEMANEAARTRAQETLMGRFDRRAEEMQPMAMPERPTFAEASREPTMDFQNGVDAATPDLTSGGWPSLGMAGPGQVAATEQADADLATTQASNASRGWPSLGMAGPGQVAATEKANADLAETIDSNIRTRARLDEAEQRRKRTATR